MRESKHNILEKNKPQTKINETSKVLAGKSEKSQDISKVQVNSIIIIVIIACAVAFIVLLIS